MAQRQQQQAALDQAQRYSLQRLEYETDQARRRYEQVDPCRLVAAELERRWEAEALQGPGALRASAPRTRSRQGTADSPRTARGLQHVGAVAADALVPGHLEPCAAWASSAAFSRRWCWTPCARYDPTHIIVAGWCCQWLEVPCTVGTARLNGLCPDGSPGVAPGEPGSIDDEIAQRLTLKGFRSPQRPRVLASTVKRFACGTGVCIATGASSPSRPRRFHGAADRCGTGVKPRCTI